MLRYETLILTVPEVTADEIKTIEAQFDKTVQASKGSMVSFERWGKYRLAYPVKGNEYGVYFLARFEVEDPKEILETVRILCAVKFNDLIMRNMISRLDEKASLAYQRPPSLEEAPARDGFLGEGKGNGMMHGSSHHDDEDESSDEQEA